HREVRIDAQEIHRKRPAEAGKPAADQEREHEEAIDVDAAARGHAPVVDRGANLRAEARALETENQAADQHGADRDQEETVLVEIEETDVNETRQIRRQ